MKSTRHQARAVALQILYGLDTPADAENPKSVLQLQEYILKHLEHFQVPEEIRTFSSELVAGAYLNRAKYDEMLSELSKGWRIDRMPFLDRNLLRMSLHELTKMSDQVPPKVTLDEAVELAKDFGSEESFAFINGVLDAYRKNYLNSST